MSSVSKVQQATTAVRALVEQRTSGDRLPNEAELAGLVGVSRVTVREALDRLWHEGLVVRRWGSGTYVADRGPSTGVAYRDVYVGLKGVRSLPASIAEAGHEPSLAHFSVARVEAPDWASELGRDLWEVTRCLAIDGEPAVLMRDYLPLAFSGTRINPTELSELSMDLPRFMRLNDVRIVKHESVLDATSCDDDAARLLGRDAGSPVLRARQRAVSDGGETVASAEILYETGVFGTVIVRAVG